MCVKFLLVIWSSYDLIFCVLIIVAAINKLIDYWGLKSKLDITSDPCTPGAPWAADTANPRVACDCSANTCHITHLSVLTFYHFATYNARLRFFSFIYPFISYRKIYALDISGELPQELFQLTELMDL